MARLDHSRRTLVLPLILLTAVMAVYISLCAAIIAAPLWLALSLALPCGLLIGDLFVIGHDACHQSFTSSVKINSIIGRICFLPSFHSYSLWDHGHNRIHHKYNNISGLDYVWEPLSPDEYRSASSIQRIKYRFFRSFIGMPFYYMLNIWLPKMVVPRTSVVERIGLKHYLDTTYLSIFAITQASIVALAAHLLGRDIAASLFLVIGVPLVVYQILMSAIIYVHHTHPEVSWYKTADQWKNSNGAIRGTVHVKFPFLMRLAMLEITEHTAHHYAPGVPLYKLRHMQSEFEGHSSDVVSWDFSFTRLISIINKCKLYNFDTGAWEGFPKHR